MVLKRVLVAAVVVVMAFSVWSCKKKEEAPVGQPGMGSGAPGVMMAPGETQIVVPDSVKGRWTGVKLAIEDKAAKSTKDVTVKLGSEYAIPGSALKIKVGDFLPDFRMEGSVITSSSADPNNPAVRVIVLENDKEIFKGWLYSKFPAIHPFQHEKYGLSLKEGVKG